jgi:hypothetical protein
MLHVYISPQSVCLYIAFPVLSWVNQYMPFKDKVRVVPYGTIIIDNISQIQSTQLVHNYMQPPFEKCWEGRRPL